VLTPIQTIEFLSMIIDSKEMTLTLLEDKVLRIKKQFSTIATGESPGEWSKEEQQEHINVLELKGARFALLTYIPRFKVDSVHIQMDIVALTYLINMGGTKNQLMSKILKGI